MSFAYLPIRLIQEANPEWRLVSWSLAITVIGLTLLMVSTAPPFGASDRDGSRSLLSVLHFPILFFLVAVPWPTVIEGPLIQGLTRANAATTVELVNGLGVPAIQHGNVIEVGSGMVGIDEACSGIRSFQATLMIALFFGGLYRLRALRLSTLCLAGFALSFVFNVGRTTLLTWVAARKGVPAIASWHDPAGVTILVACFICLWMIALYMGKAESRKQKVESRNAESRERKVESRNRWNSECGTQNGEHGRNSRGDEAPSNALFRNPKGMEPRHLGCYEMGNPNPPLRLALSLLAWLLLVELGTEFWYRSHEAHLPAPVTWTIDLPRDNASLRDVPMPEQTKQFLRYDEGLNAAWEEPPARRFQAIFLRWNPGRTAVYLAKSHTPEACVTATGRKMTSKADVQLIKVKGLALPARHYVFSDPSGPLHVLYCLSEDRAPGQLFDAAGLTYANRLAPVLAGRRHLGQRSVEIAVWGIPDDQEAEAALQSQLERLIRVGTEGEHLTGGN